MTETVVKPIHNRTAGACRGFTLLEILVALAIVAIGLTAIIAGVSRDLANAVRLRDKTFAHWVAMNKVTELQATDSWPSPGSQRGESLMAEQEWFWDIKVIDTDDRNVRRIDVEVRKQRRDEQAAASLIAYLGRPQK